MGGHDHAHTHGQGHGHEHEDPMVTIKVGILFVAVIAALFFIAL